jgi:uncharacterized iron-regulated protein
MTFRVALPLLCALAATLLPPFVQAQAPDARYRVYRPDGRPATLAEIADAMAAVDVVFVGEQHDDPTAHALEADLLRLAYERHGQSGDRRPVALSLEMFERDVQAVVDEYLAGLVNEDHFLKSSRPWGNYKSDYRALVEFARDRRLPVLAANAPARYVNRVGRLGRASLDALPKGSKGWLPPLPYGEASTTYAAKFQETMKGMPHGQPGAGPKPDPALPPLETRMLDAQALRDAAMADAIARYLRDTRRALVVHVNGAFHSESKLGVPEHLAQYRSKARTLVVTIASGPEGDYTRFETGKVGGLGDFVVLTDPALPRTR